VLFWRFVHSFSDGTSGGGGGELFNNAIMIYKLSRSFPKEELYGITDQLRRASISLTSNIAGGFGRRTGREKAHFFSIALGYLREITSQIILSKDIGYLDEECYRRVLSLATTAGRVTTGLYMSAVSNAKYTCKIQHTNM
jgi:four helix bundle protein